MASRSARMVEVYPIFTQKAFQRASVQLFPNSCYPTSKTKSSAEHWSSRHLKKWPRISSQVLRSRKAPSSSSFLWPLPISIRPFFNGTPKTRTEQPQLKKQQVSRPAAPSCWEMKTRLSWSKLDFQLQSQNRHASIWGRSGWSTPVIRFPDEGCSK